MGSYDPFGYLRHELWPKKGLKVKLAICSQPLKVRIHPICLCGGGVSHTVEFFLTKATTFP